LVAGVVDRSHFAHKSHFSHHCHTSELSGDNNKTSTLSPTASREAKRVISPIMQISFPDVMPACLLLLLASFKSLHEHTHDIVIFILSFEVVISIPCFCLRPCASNATSSKAFPVSDRAGYQTQKALWHSHTQVITHYRHLIC
jgi:hypothetical protein